MDNLFPKTPYQWILVVWGVVSCFWLIAEFQWSSAINALVCLSVLFSTYKSKTDKASAYSKSAGTSCGNSNRLAIGAILDPVYITDRPSAVKKNINLAKLVSGGEVIRTLDMIYISDRPAVLQVLLSHIESPISTKDAEKIIDLIYISDRPKCMQRMYLANSKFDAVE